MVSRDFQHTIIPCRGISRGKTGPPALRAHPGAAAGTVRGPALGSEPRDRGDSVVGVGTQREQSGQKAPFWCFFAPFLVQKAPRSAKPPNLSFFFCLCVEPKSAALLLPLQQGVGGGGRRSQRKSLSKCTFFHKTTEPFLFFFFFRHQHPQTSPPRPPRQRGLNAPRTCGAWQGSIIKNPQVP